MRYFPPSRGYRSLRPLFFLLLFLLMAPAAFAQTSVTDDDVNAVASGLYCPVCESIPLDVCPTQACIDWRDLIRDQLESGMNEAEIHDYFALQYGDQVLAEPPRHGRSLIVWLLPLIGVPAAAIIFGRYLMAIRRAHPESESGGEIEAEQSESDAGSLDRYIARIEAELTHE